MNVMILMSALSAVFEDVGDVGARFKDHDDSGIVHDSLYNTIQEVI